MRQCIQGRGLYKLADSSDAWSALLLTEAQSWEITYMSIRDSALKLSPLPSRNNILQNPGIRNGDHASIHDIPIDLLQSLKISVKITTHSNIS